MSVLCNHVKAVSRNLRPDWIMKTWWIQDECQACVRLPCFLWGNQRRTQSIVIIKRKAPHVHFPPKGMEIRHQGLAEKKQLSDKSNGCWIEIHWITKCTGWKCKKPARAAFFHHCAALYGSSSKASLFFPSSSSSSSLPTSSTLPYPLKEYCTH